MPAQRVAFYSHASILAPSGGIFQPDCRGLAALRFKPGPIKRKCHRVEQGQAPFCLQVGFFFLCAGVFAIGAGLAAASGVLFAPMAGVSHTMGLDWVLKAFIVVVVGGMGNLGGSIAAAIFISLLESYASVWVNPSQAVIVSFVVLILTLLFRPTGLFVPTPK